MTETTLNLRGLKCPLPVLRARKALSAAASGDTIVVECTDPLAQIDIPNLLRETGDVLDGREHRGDLLIFRLRKSPR
jgi:tRNA 2-thiouridine synthesizing protein A